MGSGADCIPRSIQLVGQVVDYQWALSMRGIIVGVLGMGKGDQGKEATAVGVPLQETGYIQLGHTRQRLSLPASGANQMGFWATGRAAAG